MRSPDLTPDRLLIAGDRLELHFADFANGRHVGLGEVAGHGLVDLRSLDELDEADLRGVVAVLRMVLSCVMTHGPTLRTVTG